MIPVSDDELNAPIFLDEEGDERALEAEFSTATMGHVLLGQGRSEEALAVFRAVLARNPDDADAARGIDLIVKPHASEPPPAASTVAAAEDDDLRTWARALPVDPNTLALYWNVRTEDLHAVGADGRTACALLVVSHRIGPWGLERAEHVVTQLPRAGERVETTLTDGAMHHLAVGVFLDGVFVPLARAVPISTPPAGLPAVLTSAVEALPVLLPPRIVVESEPVAAAESVPASAPASVRFPAPAGTTSEAPVAVIASTPTPVEAPVSEPDPMLYAFFAAAWARGVSSSPSAPLASNS